ncbi:hypothetical protein [Brucella intermedia]|uniref:hypothetical protein n=1 Tax=Brucella intermedia TaxID=94625 RepID=UPI001FE4B047|nr:hypothetical protein [Brucella intermedia]
MIKKLPTLPGPATSLACSVLLTVLSLVTALTWWGQMRTAYNHKEADSYSLNRASGVHMSKFNDIREIVGTKSNSSAYASYLGELSRTFGEADNGFHWAIEKPGADWLARSGPNRQLIPVKPVTNDDYIFGIQRSTRISILPLEDFPASLIGQWVELIDGSGRSIEAVIASGTNSEIVVIGNLPINFFPTQVTSLEGAKRSGEEITIVSATNIATNLHGGIISGTDGRGIYVSGFGRRGKPRFRPTIGDTVNFASGDKRKIESVMKLASGYFVVLGGDRLQAHFFNRVNIIAVTANKPAPARGLMIRVNPVSNEVFLNGRERKFRVAVDPASRIKQGALISLDSGGGPFFVGAANGDHLEIDILTSLAMQACLAGVESDDGVFFDGLSGVAAEWLLKKQFGISEIRSCLQHDSLIVDGLERTIARWEDLTEKQEQSFAAAFGKQGQISMEEVWNRSMNLELVTATDDQAASPQPRPSNIHDKTIWEIYPGSMINILYDKRNPAPVELSIHALSRKDRENYYRTFASAAPDYFSFTKVSPFTAWLENWHWPLFKQVLQHYKLQYSNPDFGLWKRDDATDYRETAAQQISSFLPVKLPPVDASDSCAFTLREVVISYNVTNSVSYIPVIGRSTRYLISIDGVDTSLLPPTPVSLPTDVSSFSFPVFARAGDQVKLDMKKLGPLADYADIKIQSVAVSNISVGDRELEEMFLDNEGMKMIAADKEGCSLTKVSTP